MRPLGFDEIVAFPRPGMAVPGWPKRTLCRNSQGFLFAIFPTKSS